MKTRLLNLLRAAAHRVPEALLGVFVVALAPMAALAARELWRQIVRLADSPAAFWETTRTDPWPVAAALVCVLGAALLAYVLWRAWFTVWAVARKIIIEALHRKVVLVLLLFFVVLMLSMPFILKTEGSIRSQVQLVLLYSLVLAMVLLSLLAIFLSAASICSEIEHKQVHITDTKPLRRWQFLLGKWFGVVVLCTAALFAMSAAACGFVLYLARPPDLSPMDRREAAKVQEDYRGLVDEVLVGRRTVKPVPLPGVAEHVRKQIAERQAAGTLSRSPHLVASARERLTKEANMQAMTIPAGGRYLWRFEGLRPGKPGGLHVRFRAYGGGPQRALAGQWLVMRRGTTQVKEGKTQVELAMLGIVAPPEYGWTASSRNQFTIPASAVPKDGTLFLAFENTGTTATVAFDGVDPVEVIQREGAFLPNYYRTVLVLVTHIALLAALGLMAGSLFSFPVASVLVVFFFIVGLVGPWFTSFLQPDPFVKDTPLHEMLGAAWRGALTTIVSVLPHFGKYNPLGDLTDGKTVTWGFVAGSAAVMVFVKGGAALLIGMYFYARRELARIIV